MTIYVRVRTLMTVTSGQTQGWSFGVQHTNSWTQYYGGSVSLSSVSINGTGTATVQGGSPPDTNHLQIRSGFNGFTQGVSIDNDEGATLSPVTDFVTAKACFAITAPSYTGIHPIDVKFSHDIGNPRIRAIVTQDGQSKTVCANNLQLVLNVTYSPPYPGPTQGNCGYYGAGMAQGGDDENSAGDVASDGLPDNLTPRTPLPKEELALATNPDYKQRLIVKFVDSAIARSTPDANITFFGSQTSLSLGNVSSIASQYMLTFSPLLDMPYEKIEALRSRAAQVSGFAQPDLAGIMIVHMKEETPDTMLVVGNALLKLEEVEYVYLESMDIPPPLDIPPVTPLFQGNQRYRDPDPGMDVDFAWEQGDAKGQGVRLTDCEFSWRLTHEDLVDVNIQVEPGQTPTTQFQLHGTSVLGITCSKENNYGCTGIAPDADIHVHPEATTKTANRRVACIASAMAASMAGDVVLLEMQSPAMVPAEVDPAVYDAVKVGTDAGVIVVAAAGNANKNLDTDNTSDLPAWRARADSGAIIVGGGTDDINHDRWTFTRVPKQLPVFASTVHGWGRGVFTLWRRRCPN